MSMPPTWRRRANNLDDMSASLTDHVDQDFARRCYRPAAGRFEHPPASGFVIRLENTAPQKKGKPVRFGNIQDE